MGPEWGWLDNAPEGVGWGPHLLRILREFFRKLVEICRPVFRLGLAILSVAGGDFLRRSMVGKAMGCALVGCFRFSHLGTTFVLASTQRFGAIASR